MFALSSRITAALMTSSPFLEISTDQWTASNALAFAVLDGFPVSRGHTLVITKRLVATWFDARPTDSPTPFEIEVPNAAKYTTHVPVYDLVAAAGEWGDEGVPDEIGWLEVPDRKLTPGMFVAQVVGRSMEPKIPSGSWCLFGTCPQGSRQGRLLLVQVNTHTDPEDGGRYTIKRYHSTKTITEEGWQHTHIELQPLNPDFAPIEIDSDNATDMRVIGEFVSPIQLNSVSM